MYLLVAYSHMSANLREIAPVPEAPPPDSWTPLEQIFPNSPWVNLAVFNGWENLLVNFGLRPNSQNTAIHLVQFNATM